MSVGGDKTYSDVYDDAYALGTETESVDLACNEIVRARALHSGGFERSTQDARLRILVEEVGEIARALNEVEHAEERRDAGARTNSTPWLEGARASVEDAKAHVLEEIVQVAATALRWAAVEPLSNGAQMTKPNAEYLKELRAKAIAAGRCSMCRARDARPNLKTCAKCSSQSHRYDKRRRAKRLCLACGAKVEAKNRSRCPACLKRRRPKENARNARRKAQALEAGLCVRCRRRPHARARQYCVDCLGVLTNNTKKWYAAKSNRTPRAIEVRHCGACGDVSHYANSARCPLAHVPTLG